MTKEKSGYKSLTSFEKHETNPFMDDLFERRIKKKTVYRAGIVEGENLINKDTGEEKGHTAIMRKQEVDQEKFVKVFVEGISRFWGLEQTAMRVFAYIVDNLKPQTDQIFIHPEMVKDEAGYKTKKSITRGIAQLIDKGFLSRSKFHHWYFINPNIFFNGNRLSFIDSYVNADAYEKESNKKLSEKANDKELPNSGESGE